MEQHTKDYLLRHSMQQIGLTFSVEEGGMGKGTREWGRGNVEWGRGIGELRRGLGMGMGKGKGDWGIRKGTGEGGKEIRE